MRGPLLGMIAVCLSNVIAMFLSKIEQCRNDPLVFQDMGDGTIVSIENYLQDRNIVTVAMEEEAGGTTNPNISLRRMYIQHVPTQLNKTFERPNRISFSNYDIRKNVYDQ